MDNYSIKSVTFGGFDKQDVIRYIEQAAEQAAAAQKALQEENHALREQAASLSVENASLRTQLESIMTERTLLQDALEEASAQRDALEALKPLEAEVTALRPDAEAYAQFRESLGAIECEARKRAADLEGDAIAHLQRAVELFRTQYQTLMETFEATASHVTGELRKIEVNLTQLPRAMDQSGADLKELAARLEQVKNQTT